MILFYSIRAASFIQFVGDKNIFFFINKQPFGMDCSFYLQGDELESAEELQKVVMNLCNNSFITVN